MHAFDELAASAIGFALANLKELEHETVLKLQESGATSLVKSLQMIQLQKAILAVGIFSIFEANICDKMGGTDGFKIAGDRLQMKGEETLHQRFRDFVNAINVLKHGPGRSYDKLNAAIEILPFKMKRPGEHFFFEGDVAEISTLIEVDDAFVMNCVEVIREVSNVLDPCPPKTPIQRIAVYPTSHAVSPPQADPRK